MEYFTKVFNVWQIKLAVASIIAVFGPFRATLWILLAFIIIDTITGCCNAVKTRKFSSKRFKKGAEKIVTYSTTVIVVRLLEIAIAPLIETTMITRLMATFLIMTEAISILENLTLCGVPLPPEILRLILGGLNFGKFYEIFGKGFDKRKYITEIDEIIQYQVPLIKAEYTQRLLVIKFEEWKNSIIFIDQQMSDNATVSNDLLFYRISSLINSTLSIINDKWIEEGIPKKCIDSFNRYHIKRVEEWIEDIKEVCYAPDTMDNKRKAIIEKTMTILYQTIIDVQKGQELK